MHFSMVLAMRDHTCIKSPDSFSNASPHRREALQRRNISAASVFRGAASPIARAQALSLKSQGYVQAARILGYGPFRIMFTQLLPNMLGPIIVIATQMTTNQRTLIAAVGTRKSLNTNS